MSNLVTGTKIIVDKQDGRLETKTPIALRNVSREAFIDIAQILNVVEINKTDNASLLWNSSTNRYEVKPIPGAADSDVDGGTF